jgi:signal transduction histidine kinase
MTLTAARDAHVRTIQQDAELIELHQRLIASEHQLQQARMAAEEAKRSKAEFIANISHELRTPLQSIIGFSELGASVAHTRAGHGDYADMFGDICAGGQRMLRLVNALLEVASVSSSVGSLRLQRVDLIELIESVVSAVKGEAQKQTQAQGHAISLPLSFEHPADPVWAWIDAARMQQVLRNVLMNAQRFAANTVTHITCTDHTVNGITVTVRDHGPGIPDDELEAVFEPFFQSSRTRDGSGGVGLGLTVCRKIMGAHGGSIDASNAADGGCVMRIRLPHGMNERLIAQESAQQNLHDSALLGVQSGAQR